MRKRIIESTILRVVIPAMSTSSTAKEAELKLSA